MILGPTIQAQPGFQPAWPELDENGFAVSAHHREVSLPACELGEPEVFFFTSRWRAEATDPDAWLGWAPCSADDEDGQCMSKILNRSEKRVFCFAPGTYLAGDDSLILLHTSGTESEPRVIRPAHDRLDWQDRSVTHEVILRTSISLANADHWILSGFTLREDHWWLGPHRTNRDWDGDGVPETGEGAKRRYFCRPVLDGYGYLDHLENEGHTLDLQCSSNNIFDRLKILDSQAPPVRIAFASHDNLLQDSLIGYSAEVAAPWLGSSPGPLAFFDALNDAVLADEAYGPIQIYNPTDTPPTPGYRSHAQIHREHGHILHDNFCITLSPWQDKPGRNLVMPDGEPSDSGRIEASSADQFVQGNHIVDNELMNCNDAIQLATKPNRSDRPHGAFHRFIGTVIQGNDMYIEPALYTDCSGNSFTDPADDDGTHPTWTQQRVCSTAENAIDLKGGGGAISSDPEELIEAQTSIPLEDLVLIDSNRLWGFRHVDPLLGQYDQGALAHEPFTVDGIGSRAATGTAIVSHVDTSHVLFSRNLIFDSASGLRQDNGNSSQRPEPSGSGWDRQNLYYAAISNLFYDIRWDPMPEDDPDFATATQHDGGATLERFFDPDLNSNIWRGGNPSWRDGWYSAALIFASPFDLYLNSVVHSRNWHEASGFGHGSESDSPTRFVCNAVTQSGPGGVYRERHYCDRCSGDSQQYGHLPVWATVEDNAFYASGTLPEPPAKSEPTDADWAEPWNDAVDWALPDATTHAAMSFELKRITRHLPDPILPTRLEIPDAVLTAGTRRLRCNLLRQSGFDFTPEPGPDLWWSEAWRELTARGQ